ncbi:hypothetical protein [Pseudoroseicyclus tamaricis]|uniref:Chemotaxis protein CheA n=1 Tax=Pseudoroseicyclus tamaricis TaxID=2705421 RepID=A0A6B2JG55_9RHOB|nr:hypothetical protein [Pseudoroseicyclus tamaricis]NDV00131.1 hypothetical protein [Pseudoroseicyclus tamaricis]
MVGSSKILTVSYGTFSCTLEGFDDSFGTMKAIAEYFRDLAADDRYFGAEPATPDADMLARIAEREIARRVEARTEEGGIVLRAAQLAAPAAVPQAEEEPEAETAEPEVKAESPVEEPAEEATPAMPPSPGQLRNAGGGNVADKLARIRAVVGSGAATAAGEAVGQPEEAELAEVEEETVPAEDARDWSAEDVSADEGMDDAPETPAPAEAEPALEETPEPEAPAVSQDETAPTEALSADSALVGASDPALADEVALLLDVSEGEDAPDAVVADEAPAEEVAPEQDVTADDLPEEALADEELADLEAQLAAGDAEQAGAEVPEVEETPSQELAMPYDTIAGEADYDHAPAPVEQGPFEATTEPSAPEAPETAPEPGAEAPADQVGPALPESEPVGAEETDSPYVGTLSDTDEAALLAELAALEAELGADADLDAAMAEAAGEAAESAPAPLPEPTAFRTAPEPEPEATDSSSPDIDELAAAEAELQDWAQDEAAPARAQSSQIATPTSADEAWEAELDAALAEEFGEAPEPAAEAAPEVEDESTEAPSDDVMAEDAPADAPVSENIPEDDLSDNEDDADAWPTPAQGWDGEESADDGESLFSGAEEAEPAPALHSEADDEAWGSENDEDDAPATAERDDPLGQDRPAWDDPRPFSNAPEADGAGLDRILSRTEDQLAEPGNSRRRAAIAQLKAAVAATEAARRLGEGDGREGKLAAFRDDLDQVVRPRRPVRADQPSERPRTAPLKLVASQRVDTAESRGTAEASPAAPVRPRRVMPGESVEPPRPAPQPQEAEAEESFPAYAAEAGAESLSDLLEAAAAYTAQIEGAEDFSRPQLMRLVGEAAPEGFSREEGLRSFGTLLRQGRIVKVRSGRFALSGTSRFHPERRAG